MTTTFRATREHIALGEGMLATHQLYEPADAVQSLLRGSARPEASKADGVEKVYAPRGRAVINPFIEAVHVAFDQHYPLALSPDHVWLCIAQGFANHVNLHSDAYRDRLVGFEGKKDLVVIRDSFVKGSPVNDWEGVFGELSAQLHAHIGKTRDLVVSDFSTTTPAAKAASEIVLMDAMQAFFDYTVLTRCGIPQVTLLGTVADWRRLKAKFQALTELDLWWTKGLAPIVDKIVESAEGKPDTKFWESFYKVNGGSGGPYVTGWINTLFPYIARAGGGGIEPNRYATEWASSGDWGGGPNPSSFLAGVSKAPFLWKYLGTDIPMNFLGGFIGFQQADTATAAREGLPPLTIQPTLGWAVTERG